MLLNNVATDGRAGETMRERESERGRGEKTNYYYYENYTVEVFLLSFFFFADVLLLLLL